MFHYKTILHILGLLLLFNGGAMLIASLVSLFLDDGATSGLFLSTGITFAAGLSMMLLTLKQKREIKILEEKSDMLNRGEEVRINDVDEEKFLSSIGLLSIKPKIIVCNVDEENISKGNKYTQDIKKKYPNEKIINICADIEDQLSGLDKNEKENFMKDIGLNKTGLNKLIREGYDLLMLETFFTSGPKESRAWTIRKNTPAPKAASVIHTDFEKNFIRAEAVTCEDFIKYGSAEKCKENGKLRIEGKDYIVKDGDVLYFRVNP